jgi:hypothetical protein
MVHTHGGVHLHWLFREPFVMDNDGDRHEFAQLSARFATTLAARAHDQEGWTLDRLGDLARILRAPGMVTSKYHRLVTLHTETPMRYNPVQDFDDWLEVVPIPTTATRATTGLGPSLDIQAVADHYRATLTKKSATELTGPHPHHGSSTGTNFNLNLSKGLWHCWRCDSGGDALALVAICEGLIPCDQSRRGAFTGDLFHRLAQIAATTFGVDLRQRLRTTVAVPMMTTIKAAEVPSCL